METQSTRPTAATRTWRLAIILGLALALTGSAGPPEPPLTDVVGADDFRISDMGADGSTTPTAVESAVVYYPTADPDFAEYLVVWRGDDTGGGSFAIFGQRLLASGGSEIGTNDFQISDADPSVAEVAAAHNTVSGQSLVVWMRDDGGGQQQVFGQLLDNDGSEIGIDFEISDNMNGDATAPAVVANSSSGEYLVVWSGEVDGVPGEREIFGEILDMDGAPVLETFQISDMGPDADPAYDALEPALAWSSERNEYLVVWRADDNALADDEFEIFGQRLDAAGAEIGSDDFRLSDMGPDGNPDYDALEPALVYNANNDEYLVVWRGDDNTPPLVDGELEIFGQRLAGDGSALGAGDFQISDLGSDGSDGAEGLYDPGPRPAVTYSSANNEYLVAWSGTDEPLTSGEQEIYLQRLDAGRADPFTAIHELGPNDYKISAMGPDGDATFLAELPAVAFAEDLGELLVVWRADDDTPPLAADEFEIFGQRFAIPLQYFVSDGSSFAQGENPELAFGTPGRGSGGEFRVWQGDDQHASGIFGGFFDGSTLIGTEFQINTYTTGDQTEPHLAYDNLTDEFMVVWQGATQDDPSAGIAGQRVGAGGGLLGPELQVNSFTTGDQTEPRVGFDRVFNQFMIVWTDASSDGDGLSGITGQRFRDGKRLGTEFQVHNFTGGVQRRPSLAFDDVKAEFLVAWQSQATPGDGSDFGISGNRFRAGKRLGTEFLVNTETSGPQEDPDIAFDSSSETFLVSWRDVVVSGSAAIRGQRFRAGKRLGTEFQSTNPARADSRPRVVSDSEGTFSVVWERDDEQGDSLIVKQLLVADPPEVSGDEEVVDPGSSPVIGSAGINAFSVLWQADATRGQLPLLLDKTFDVATDLNLRVTDTPDLVDPGGLLTYTVKAINDGPGSAAGVFVETLLPPDLTPQATSGCQNDPGGVPTCTIGELGSSEVKTFTVEVVVDADFTPPVAATFTIQPATTPPDPDLSGNTASALTWSSELLIDGFESGDCSAWTIAVPGCG